MTTDENSAELAAAAPAVAATPALDVPQQVPRPPDNLAARAKAGDLSAFEALVRQNRERILRTALHMLANREDARDAAQEVFIRMYSYLHNLKPDRPIEPWLYKITLNVCRDMLKKRARTAALLAEHAQPAAVHPNPDGFERREMLLAALGTLSERERAAIVLRDLEGLSTKETAKALKIRQVTVRTLISRARTKLKRACDAGGDADEL